MSSERFLDSLAADLQPVAPRRDVRDLAVLGCVGAIELALFFAFGAARPDITTAMVEPSFWWKLTSLGALTVIGALTAIHSFYPTSSPRRGLRILAMAVGVAFAIGWIIDGLGLHGDTLVMRLMWHHGLRCVVTMSFLSIPAIVAFGILMRRGAPTDREGTALAVGVASAAWGAFVFVFNCPHDDPLNVAVWYTIGCSVVALLGRLILPSIARW